MRSFVKWGWSKTAKDYFELFKENYHASVQSIIKKKLSEVAFKNKAAFSFFQESSDNKEEAIKVKAVGLSITQ